MDNKLPPQPSSFLDNIWHKYARFVDRYCANNADYMKKSIISDLTYREIVNLKSFAETEEQIKYLQEVELVYNNYSKNKF